ncbi:MAG: helix-turn-helix transcriptional regulator [Clostridium sp.]|uniref:winged helix-turn-helix transcriptional regulator n=1 Tax=Clostridium sp. TaxID=1506 RepID=UPI0025C3AD01|nr:helix-turn-helix domain-containing protein [Clostridium sp.]MCF0148531.1 helix-turn-helix transcriptional regulator [Clostridium sp.]
MEKFSDKHEDCYLNNNNNNNNNINDNDLHETCPMILVHKLISGKWKILILWYLVNGPLRFGDIKRNLPNVTQKMLTNQLRSLEADNLIYRKVYAVIPPKVEYGLTEMGKRIIPVLEAMHNYGEEYILEMKE